jgi:hypothetical protein
MKQYYITYRVDELPAESNTSCAVKWAHNEKDAVRLLLQSNPDKDGKCRLKRGGTGKILSVEELTN